VGDREIRNAAGLARGNRVPALGPNSVMNWSFARGRHGLQMDLTQTGFFADELVLSFLQAVVHYHKTLVSQAGTN